MWRDIPPKPKYTSYWEASEFSKWLETYQRPIVKAMHEAGVLSPNTDMHCIDLDKHFRDALAILTAE